MLTYDIARCTGTAHPNCRFCQRREPSNASRQVWIAPPIDTLTGACSALIEPLPTKVIDNQRADMDKNQGVITRDEWVRRYATRIHERAGWTMEEAMFAANNGAAVVQENSARENGKAVVWWGGPDGEHNTPETEADEEMSCWTDDGED